MLRFTRAEDKGPVVFAAASLKDALDGVSAAWQKETGKSTVISYAASSALAKQIEQGAPADVFISADEAWMDYLAKRNLIEPDTRFDLLGNGLVLIAPKDATLTAKIARSFPLASLLGDGRLAMAETGSVPAGKYGKAALETLGVWDAVKDKVAQTENVRAALVLVSRSEAPLGIVYATDAKADPNVKVLDIFPEDTHPPIVYPVAIMAASANADADAFVTYLKSSTARRVFEAQGFNVLSSR
ncbi:MAG: molybdate ABC transporter substrate-binding protein [Methyloceanibacter sp.]